MVHPAKDTPELSMMQDSIEGLHQSSFSISCIPLSDCRAADTSIGISFDRSLVESCVTRCQGLSSLVLTNLAGLLRHNEPSIGKISDGQDVGSTLGRRRTTSAQR